MLPRHRSTLLDCIAIAVLVVATFAAPGASGAKEAASAGAQEPTDFFGVIGKSLAGDVYDAARWHELSFWSFFTNGWDEPWASGPNGEGGAPRQGWLNGIGAFSPVYNFWWNAVAGLVLRGSVGGFVPFSGPNTRESFIANLAAGYYFTPHDLLPIGDLVWYVSTNLNQLTDGEVSGTQVPNNTTLTFSPDSAPTSARTSTS